MQQIVSLLNGKQARRADARNGIVQPTRIQHRKLNGFENARSQRYRA